MADLASDLMPGGVPEFTASILKKPVLTALMRHLLVTQMESRDSLEKEAVLVSTLHFILSKYGLTGKLPAGDRPLGRHPVKEAKRLLASDLDQKISLDRVAQRVGLSRFHFLRIFKENTGISPHLYRTIKRIEAAKKFLSQGMLPAQAAFETGFADQSHFSNTFRRYVGATPRQYLA
jgi:AraC-like DNA-binding protein